MSNMVNEHPYVVVTRAQDVLRDNFGQGREWSDDALLRMVYDFIVAEGLEGRWRGYVDDKVVQVMAPGDTSEWLSGSPDRHGDVEIPDVSAACRAFEDFLGRKGYKSAVDECPWDGEDEVFFGAVDAEDVLENGFLDEQPWWLPFRDELESHACEIGPLADPAAWGSDDNNDEPDYEPDYESDDEPDYEPDDEPDHDLNDEP